MLEQDQVLPNLIAGRAAATPARIAIQCVDGTAMTYGELHAENMRWAAAYRRAGVTAGDHVASMVVHSFASYSVWLGLSWLKAVEVPANTGYRGTMLAYLIENSEARLLVIDAQFCDRLVEVADRVPNLERVVVLDADGASPRAAVRSGQCGAISRAALRRSKDVEAPTYRDVSSVIYTSGTTGPSKGVLVSWASLQDLYGMLPEDIIPSPDDGYYSVYPAYHVSGKAAISRGIHARCPTRVPRVVQPVGLLGRHPPVQLRLRWPRRTDGSHDPRAPARARPTPTTPCAAW